jgi:hypothetical protein
MYIKFFLTLILSISFSLISSSYIHAANKTTWEIQAIDTMKYSRDIAREKMSDADFYKVVDKQMSQIAQTGATHVAIATPYDVEFIPFMRLWVDTARKHELNVWFRGNFSGWEEWFDYPKIGRDDHKKVVEEFILNNPSLFEDGDIFTPCPECENGGPGDPRFTRDVDAYRQFLIDEYTIANNAFRKINKEVQAGYFSMNGDVASLIMDKQTTKALGGIIVVDHYVKTPEELNEDITKYAEESGGKVILGEFGAPIPDINGNMSQEQQSEWIEKALELLSKNDKLIGLNYWVGYGGSTRLWNDDGTERLAVSAIESYYSPKEYNGFVINELGNPIKNATILSGNSSTTTDLQGRFALYLSPSHDNLVIRSDSYNDLPLQLDELPSDGRYILQKTNENLLFRFAKFLFTLFSQRPIV